MDRGVQTEQEPNQRFTGSNEAAVIRSTAADRSSESMAPHSASAHPSTIVSTTTPVDNTTIDTYSIPGYNNNASPDGTSGGSVAARSLGDCNQSDSMQLQPRQPRPTPGNDTQLPTRHVRFDESAERQPQLLQQPSQASHPQQFSQSRCQQPTITPGSSAEHSDLSAVPCPVELPLRREMITDGNERNGNSGNQLAEVEAPPLVGVKTLADAVVLPSRGTPESNRRETLVVDKPIECLRKGGESSFGPTITVGEPSCIDSGIKDSGRKLQQTSFPTPGESNFPTPGESAAVAGAFPPTPHPSPTSGFNAPERIHDNSQCCWPTPAIPTPGSTYSDMHYIPTPGTTYDVQNQNFDWGTGHPAQSSSPLLRGSGGFVAALASSSGDHQNTGRFVHLTTRTTSDSTTCQ